MNVIVSMGGSVCGQSGSIVLTSSRKLVVDGSGNPEGGFDEVLRGMGHFRDGTVDHRRLLFACLWQKLAGATLLALSRGEARRYLAPRRHQF